MIFTILKYVLAIAATIVAAFFVFLNTHPVFGGKPDETTLAKMANMPSYQNGVFENLEPIVVDGSGAGVSDDERLGLMDFVMNIIRPAAGKHPNEPLPSLPLSENLPLQNNSFTWLGHSTVLFKMGDKTIMTDPVFYRVSPIPIGGQPYAMTHLPSTADVPALDVVILSHDHYDHLDKRAIDELHERVGKFLVPLGVKAHLVRWGVNADKITEFAWDEQASIDGLGFTYVPARHFSGRTFGTKNQSLWGGWVVKSADFALYFTGDSGWSKHFKDVGERYAPTDGFDLMLVENGAYNVNWADVHMFPEQSVQAVIDARAKLALPIHWGKYDLAYHPWQESAVRFSAEADKRGVAYITPKIGQNFMADGTTKTDKWWERVQ
ncbi:MAG: MBL fold metallo-hydrolase [Moraxella sp.]|nr:MBL fold metallo-hydrolase [Moraxella sp.]